MAAGGAYLVYKYRLRVSLLHYIVFAELNAFFFFFFSFSLDSLFVPVLHYLSSAITFTI